MIFSVIVLYHPDIDHIKAMCDELIMAGINVVIYDNTPGSTTKLYKDPYFANNSINTIGNKRNNGLSIAFNSCINFAYSRFDNVEGFLFFDQDSSPSRENISKLIDEYCFLRKMDIPIGILGALPIDKMGSAFDVRALKTQSFFPDKFIQTEFVISSFSFVPTSTIKKVGLFDEKLFIDLVDSEYSFRCSKHGLLNLVSKSAVYIHVIGECRGSFFGLRSFSISSPLRNYYQSRNLILVGRDYGWYWFILSKLFKRFIQVILSAYYSGNLVIRLKYFFKGIFHGALYRGGSIEG